MQSRVGSAFEIQAAQTRLAFALLYLVRQAVCMGCKDDKAFHHKPVNDCAAMGMGSTHSARTTSSCTNQQWLAWRAQRMLGSGMTS